MDKAGSVSGQLPDTNTLEFGCRLIDLASRRYEFNIPILWGVVNRSADLTGFPGNDSLSTKRKSWISNFMSLSALEVLVERMNPVHIDEPSRPSSQWVRDKLLLPESRTPENVTAICRALDEMIRSSKASTPLGHGDDFDHSPDFRTVRLRGRSFNLAPMEALIVDYLWALHLNGTFGVSAQNILGEVGAKGDRSLRNAFTGRDAYKFLIRKEGSNYRLNI